ncbi:MAG: cytochrome b [Gammaproteobacteria bacterium]|nr:cytochrome b [Gammaproteobacteria bacterium]
MINNNSNSNHSDSYGSVTKILHAIIAVLFITQFVLIYWRAELAENNPLGLTLILLHKSIGFSLLFLGLSFIVWHFISTKPPFPVHLKTWEKISATLSHNFLLIIIFLMPFSGTVMSMASNKGIKWFGYPIPNLISPNEALAGFFYNTHVYVSYITLGLLILHMLATLKHYLYDKYTKNPLDKNNIWQRMWW